MARFSYERESGADYKIFDNERRIDVMHGLDLNEAKVTVSEWNKQEEQKAKADSEK